jgi:hypothetical protein
MATDYIEAAHAKSFWAKVRRISVDETSARRGHRYVSSVPSFPRWSRRLKMWLGPMNLPFWVVIGDENFPGRGFRSQIFPDR